jgi:hypothetical protein
MLYIVFRTLYNRYALHLRGFDQIPTLPHQLTHFFSGIGDCFSSVSSKFGSSQHGLNPTSHHWGGRSGTGARDLASRIGGSRFGSGSREEEETMLAEEEGELEDGIHGGDLGDISGGGNPWGLHRGASGPRVDSARGVRL